MAELLLEVVSEEIPAGLQSTGGRALKDAVLARLSGGGLDWNRAEAYWTPRRLTVLVDGVPEKQPDVREERRGPRVDAPDRAIDGFVSSVGIARDRLEVRLTPKGEFFFAVVEHVGKETRSFLAEELATALADVTWPKSMRWGSHSVRWVRPIHSILCLFDGAIVPFSFGPTTAGNWSTGHRFHASERFQVSNYADYRAKLRDARVMLSVGEREAYIAAADGLDAAQEGLVVVEDTRLLEEVAGLVEWPVILTGAFDTAFLDIPEEILVATMRGHQKYFALRHGDGRLANRFICVANVDARDGGQSIVAGNERVLHARLADAAFFWGLDRKHTLASLVPKLSGIIFHQALGSLDHKVDRIETLALELSGSVPETNRERVRSAARLAKADLVSRVVREFPELQGVVGRYLALADGEPSDVADAIAEHYAPRGPHESPPSKPTSITVSLADKLDSLVGFFAIGEAPTGSKDPFALRRAALGVIRILLENDVSLPLRPALAAAVSGYPAEIGDRFDAEELVSFLLDRLRAHLRDRGARHDVVDAAFAVSGEDDLRRLKLRVDALAAFLGTDDGANLLAAHKRASNIVRIEAKKDGGTHSGPVSTEHLAEEVERALAARLSQVATESDDAIRRHDFVRAMECLSELRQPVDAFFDQVKVNADDLETRENRLRLLSQICDTLDQVADFARIEPSR